MGSDEYIIFALGESINQTLFSRLTFHNRHVMDDCLIYFLSHYQAWKYWGCLWLWSSKEVASRSLCYVACCLFRTKAGGFSIDSCPSGSPHRYVAPQLLSASCGYTPQADG